jgi:hypothetical protein
MMVLSILLNSPSMATTRSPGRSAAIVSVFDDEDDGDGDALAMADFLMRFTTQPVLCGFGCCWWWWGEPP